MQYARVIFNLPSKNVYHRGRLKSQGDAVLMLDSETFCLDVLDAVRKWHGAKKDEATVSANLPKLLQYRPQGLSPYIVGVPVIT